MRSAWKSDGSGAEVVNLLPGQVLTREQATAEWLLRQAVQQAREAVRKRVGGPFGALIVRRLQARETDDWSSVELVAIGHNRVLELQDPTAHAEMVVIREAAQRLRRRELSDCELYTSCFPCPMCYAATIWAKIPRFWFASESEDAARAGFDDAALYQLFRGIDGVTKVKGEHLLVAEHRSPFMEYEEALRHGMTELY